VRTGGDYRLSGLPTQCIGSDYLHSTVNPGASPAANAKFDVREVARDCYSLVLSAWKSVTDCGTIANKVILADH